MEKKKESLSIFILNYNGIDEIRSGSALSIVKAVEQLKQLSDLRISVVYLDNFSCDGSIDIVKPLFPDAVFASTFKNEGYVRGTNIGLKLAWKVNKPDYFLLVDSDNFAEEDAYLRLVEYIRKNEDAAMVQPMVKSKADSEKIVSCGHVFNERGGTSSITDPNGKYDIENLVSCSISSTLIRTEALKKTGLLNESFVMYYESSDLSFRLRKLGYRCACCKEAVTFNERLSGFRLKDFNKYYLMRRNLFLLWFLHDKKSYFHYLDVWKETREQLARDAASEEYIKNYMNEAERRALIEGYELQEHNEQEFIRIPSIEDFCKNDVCIFD